jgi:hypothetical protein
MPSLLNRVQIWNMALDLLREQPLASADDPSPAAKLLGRNYEQQRDYLMERYLWKFAKKRAALAADGTAPDYGFRYRYQLPTDKLRLIPPTIDGKENSKPIRYVEESNYILCDLTAPLRIQYIARITNEGLFSNGFCELLSIRLAMRCAHWMTGKTNLVTELRQLYKDTIDDVKQVEAVQVASESYYDTDILEERSEYY